METFPWIPAYALEEEPEFLTLISRGEKGRERRRSKRGTPLRTFKLVFPRLSTADADDMFEFYRRHKGAYGAFYWWNPEPTELLINRGFETGDFEGHTQNSAAIDSTEKYSGLYSSKLVASGATVTGALSDFCPVDITKIYTFGGAIKISGWSAGNGRIALREYDSGDTWIATAGIERTADQAWTLHEKTIGPSGSGADFTWNAAAEKVKISQYCHSTPTMNLWVDDLALRGSCRFRVRFKKDNFPREYFVYGRQRLELEFQEDPA